MRQDNKLDIEAPGKQTRAERNGKMTYFKGTITSRKDDIRYEQTVEEDMKDVV